MKRMSVLMAVAFVDMIGLMLVLPLLPLYALHLNASATTIGFLTASFPVAQLLASPVWGRFSDRYGRRPALLVGLTASAMAYVVFGFATSLWLLFLSRIVQGAGGGTVSVIQAYVADAVKPEDRAKGLGWLSAATNAGVALGPLLGSFTSRWYHAGPGLLAAGLCVCNIVFAFFFLTESRDMAEARAIGKKQIRSRDAVLRVVTHSGEAASRLIWIYAIAMGAFTGANSMLALFLSVRFSVTENTIGYFYAYIGVMSVLTRALILGWAVDRFGEARLSRF